MTEEQIIKYINQLEERIEKTIQNTLNNGLKFVSSEIKAIVAEKQQDIAVSIAKLEEGYAKQSREISKLFEIVDLIRENYVKQGQQIAEEIGASKRENNLKLLWVSISGVIVAACAYLFGRH